MSHTAVVNMSDAREEFDALDGPHIFNSLLPHIRDKEITLPYYITIIHKISLYL